MQSNEIGKPAMFGEAVGRIVSHSEDGSYANNGTMCSIVNFGTPHGSVIKTGNLYLNEITPEGMEKLIAYENECKEEFKPLYNGVLDHILPKDTETYEAKLRNQLTPLYGLSSMILMLEERKDDIELINIIINAAKQAETNKKKVDKLLTLIENKK